MPRSLFKYDYVFLSSLLRTLALCAAKSALLAVALNAAYMALWLLQNPSTGKTLHGISKLAKANLQVPAQSKTRTTA